MSLNNPALVLHKKDDLQINYIPVPKPKSNEVLISMKKIGICGSDVHYWVDGRIGDTFVVKAPMVMGHEGSGIVADVGSDVTSLCVGDRVAIEPGVPCRKCEFCKHGRYNLCPDMIFCATPPVDGNLCRLYCHAADFCYKIPDHVSLEEAAMIEPLSVAVHACRRAGLTFGDTVLVCGAGPIGLVNVITARAFGASKICITDISENRLLVAKSIGADFILNVRGRTVAETVEAVKSSLGSEANISIECSGVESSVQTCLMATKPGGVAVVVGMGKAEMNLPLTTALIREIDIRGIFRYVGCYPTALELISSGKVDVKPLITHRFAFEDALAAFEVAKSGDGIKIMISGPL